MKKIKYLLKKTIWVLGLSVLIITLVKFSTSLFGPDLTKQQKYIVDCLASSMGILAMLIMDKIDNYKTTIYINGVKVKEADNE